MKTLLFALLLVSSTALGISKPLPTPVPGPVNYTPEADKTLVPGSNGKTLPTAHPYVLMNKTQALALLSAGTPTTKQALARLAGIAKNMVAAPTKYKTAYTGCDIDQVDAQFSVGDGAVSGAETMGLYVYLTSLNAGFGDAALAKQAQQVGHDILMNWAKSAFQINGKMMTYDQFCEPNSTNSKAVIGSLVPLNVGRGMHAWAFAQDMLMAVNAFTPAELTILNNWDDGVLEMLRNAANYKVVQNTEEADRFNNQVSGNLKGMTALALLRGNSSFLKDVATGNGSSGLLLTWPLQVQEAIYGTNDSIRYRGGCVQPNCFQLATVAAGEVDDRFRAHSGQPFGYTIGSLHDLLVTSVMLETAGYSAFNYKGARGQSVQSGFDYYSYFFTKYLSLVAATVPDNGDAYPSYKQYVGQPVSGPSGQFVTGQTSLLNPYAMAFGIYPSDAKIKGLMVKVMNLGSTNVIPFEAQEPAEYAALVYVK